MQFPMRATLRSSLIVIAVSVVGVGILEATTRVYLRITSGEWPQTRQAYVHDFVTNKDPLMQKHPYLNVAPLPNATEVTPHGTHFNINSLGYRSPERPLIPPAGVLRVICSGGSTTFDVRANGYENTWPWLLEQRLRGDDLDVEVWNAGAPGWSSLENTLSLLIRDIDLKPNVVVLFAGINDLQLGSCKPFDRLYDGCQAQWLREILGFADWQLSWYDRLVLLEKINDRLFPEKNPGSELSAENRHSVLAEEALETFEHNVQAYISIGRNAGAAVILITQTVRIRKEFADEDLAYLKDLFPELEPQAAATELERLNDVTRRVAAEKHVILIDMARDLPLEVADTLDPMHFSPQGSERFAHFIAPVVAAQLARIGSEAAGD